MLPADQETAEALIRKPVDPARYRGLEPQDASRTAAALCRTAGRTGKWEHLPGHLLELRRLMRRAA